MQEHPVPQNITAYEFHLIGDMTVKQFLELAIGGALGLVLYTSNLLFFIKWPLILVSVLGGVAMAFIPVEERPLDKWLIAFIKAIYKPTKFHWKKVPKIPEIFQENLQQMMNQSQIAVTLGPTKQNKAKAYLESIATSEAQIDPLDEEFASKTISILNMFDEVHPAKGILPTRSPQSPEDEIQDLLLAGKPSLRVSPHYLSGTINMTSTTKTEEKPDEAPTPQKKAFQERRYVDIPIAQAVKVDRVEPVVADQKPAEKKQAPTMPQTLQQTPTAQTMKYEQAAALAKTNAQLPFPKKPTAPNILVGMVLDANGNILENAILEIRRNDGTPVRALKTNALGQFSVTTPLQQGQYDVAAEKDGYIFDTVSIFINNTILDPIEIRARQALPLGSTAEFAS